MNIELISIPLAWVAGVLSILSPCVWPIVPIVMASASGKGWLGPIALSLGLSLSFAFAGTVLTYALLNIGLNPDAFRWVGAALMALIGLLLVVRPLSEWASSKLSQVSSRFPAITGDSATAYGQFGIGFLLGLIWLPCVGPTLGAAIALASLGQDMGMAFIVMVSFGFGTGVALIAAAVASNKLLSTWRPQLLQNAAKAKRFLGWLLLVLGVMVLTKFDKVLETLALQYLPTWAISL